jgi:hypothetical protein
MHAWPGCAGASLITHVSCMHRLPRLKLLCMLPSTHLVPSSIGDDDATGDDDDPEVRGSAPLRVRDNDARGLKTPMGERTLSSIRSATHACAFHVCLPAHPPAHTHARTAYCSTYIFSNEAPRAKCIMHAHARAGAASFFDL